MLLTSQLEKQPLLQLVEFMVFKLTQLSSECETDLKHTNVAYLSLEDSSHAFNTLSYNSQAIILTIGSLHAHVPVRVF